mgnify:CR=1 FL=1
MQATPIARAIERLTPCARSGTGGAPSFSERTQSADLEVPNCPIGLNSTRSARWKKVGRRAQVLAQFGEREQAVLPHRGEPERC